MPRAPHRWRSGCWAEADVGLGRVGVSPGEELVQLAQAVSRLPHLSFEGITFYPGHIKDNGETGARQMAELRKTIQGMLDDLKRAGLTSGHCERRVHPHVVPLPRAARAE